ncbi:ZinT/AdcA family metal-binding protein [Peptoniphilus duerdenii]|uniref:ZinT/AdcA family metal-binding protein n=1 Tax=Peptoniphilus duerdenii TaxID=507750 RepID=UPI0023F1BC8A|nr:ZinT/AdcA family metal-binding protein [Peptoniphilus duerdenii]
MKNNFKFIAVFLLCLTLLVGCGKKDDNGAANEKNNKTNVESDANKNQGSEKESEDSVTLADWEGTWNSIEGYLDAEEVQGAYEALGKKDGKSAEEAKAAYKEKRHSDFLGMKIEGNNVTFLDNFEDKDGKAIETSEYEFVHEQKTKFGSKDLEWFVFKSKNPDSKFPILLLMRVDPEEELIHFHMRYGSDENELLGMDKWFPTYVKPDSTLEQISNEIAE